jgi:hypothetical protein
VPSAGVSRAGVQILMCRKDKRARIAARVIVVMAAAACLGAAQAGGESLRANIAATQQQVNPESTVCRSIGTYQNRALDCTQAAHEFCCLRLNIPYKQPVTELLPTECCTRRNNVWLCKCDNVMVECRSIGIWPKC